MNRFTLLVFVAIAMALLPQGASAQIWNEVGDAGDLITTEQNTVGMGALTTITGSLDPFGAGDYVDVYCITITDKTFFTATLSGSTINPLWLFDANKNGVTSQEGFYLNTPSQITGKFVANPGIYHLAISTHDILPFNPSLQDIWNTSPRSVETSPNGAGAPGPLASWLLFGIPVGGGNYTIALTGTDYGNCVVPEPNLLTFASVVGLSGLTLFLRRRKK